MRKNWHRIEVGKFFCPNEFRQTCEANTAPHAKRAAVMSRISEVRALVGAVRESAMFITPPADEIPKHKVPAEYRHAYCATLPEGARVIAGPFAPREMWMLENHCNDMTKAGRKFGIAPDGCGLSTFAR